MKRIEYKILKPAIFGSVNTYEEDGVLKLRRFTKKQLEHFDATLNYINKPKKSKASSGMNIDFYTDSTVLEIDLNCYVASSQNPCFIDIYVDGIMEGHFGYKAKEDGKINARLELGEGKKQVTIWLPCLFEANMVDFRLDDGAVFEPAKKDCNVLFLGDSITQGYTSEFPSLTYTNIITRKLNAHSINHGIGAGLFDASDLDEDFPFEPDKIFVAYGTNDWYHSGDRDLPQNANAFYQKLCRLYPNAQIYAILPIWRGNLVEKGKNATMSFEEMHVLLADICKNYNVTVIDGMELTPHYEGFFLPDLTHPNEMGFLHYGENLYKAIRKENKK